MAMDFVNIYYNETDVSKIDQFINQHVDADMATLFQMGEIVETDNVSDLQFVDSADYEAEDESGSGVIVKMRAKNAGGESIQIFVYTLNKKILIVAREDLDDGSAFDSEKINEMYFN